MKNLLPTIHQSITPSLQPAAPDDRSVLAACHEALKSERDYVPKACLAGMLLIEYRKELLLQICPSHGGTGRTNTDLRHNQHTLPDSNFTLWLESNGLSKTTAYRWMSAAEGAGLFALNLVNRDLPATIDVEGIAIPLSEALRLPDSELTGKALHFKQSWFTFMADKTLSEAARAVVDGESAGHRISKAAAGKTRGGKGDVDRKEFVLFACRALKECVNHIGTPAGRRGGHWNSLSTVEKQGILNCLHLFMKGLPDEALDYIKDDSRVLLSGRKNGAEPEPLALKAHYDALWAARGEKAKAAHAQRS